MKMMPFANDLDAIIITIIQRVNVHLRGIFDVELTKAVRSFILKHDHRRGININQTCSLLTGVCSIQAYTLSTGPPK